MEKPTVNISLLLLLLREKSALRFLLGVIFSFAFSISVILGTVGIMDGFDSAMKRAMKRVTGDMLLFSREGFFDLEQVPHSEESSLKSRLHLLGIKEYAPWVKTEGFLIHGETAKGVLIKGIDAPSFSEVTGINFRLKEGEVLLGDELATALNLHSGDQLVLAFANGNKSFSSLPLLYTFRLAGTIHHGTYKEDMRIAYLPLADLQKLLGLGRMVNTISFNIPKNSSFTHDPSSKEYLDSILRFKNEMMEVFGPFYKILPYWQQYESLFEAVRMQKFIIGLILQLIVIASIFNIMAFIIYLNERRSSEIFLFQALGVSKKRLLKVWGLLIFILWFISCFCAKFLVDLFDFALQHLSILKMPGEIYYLSRFSIKLGLFDYALVFGLALLWAMLLTLIVFYRLRKKSVLTGLRKEFS